MEENLEIVREPLDFMEESISRMNNNEQFGQREVCCDNTV